MKRVCLWAALSLLTGPLYAGIGESGDLKPAELNETLQRATGLRADVRIKTVPASLLDNFIDIYLLLVAEFGGPLDKLQSVQFVSFPGRGLAYYREHDQAIVLNVEKLSDTAAARSTIAHELGHAFIFSRLSPRALAGFAKREGHWKIQQGARITSFHSPKLFRRFSGPNTKPTAFPTSYSYTNIHEWFAENFAQHLLHRAGYQSEALLSKVSFIKLAQDFSLRMK